MVSSGIVDPLGQGNQLAMAGHCQDIQGYTGIGAAC